MEYVLINTKMDGQLSEENGKLSCRRETARCSLLFINVIVHAKPRPQRKFVQMSLYLWTVGLHTIFKPPLCPICLLLIFSLFPILTVTNIA